MTIFNAWKIKLTEAEYDALMRKRWRCFSDKATVTVADVEPVVGNEPMGQKEEAGRVAPCHCSIAIHSRTKRLADADGRAGKSVIDSLVLAGIIKDDSPKYVSQVSYSQEKVSGPEETIITLTWSET